MIYELFVRKSFIRSPVSKIIIFAVSFIHSEYVLMHLYMQINMEQNVRQSNGSYRARTGFFSVEFTYFQHKKSGFLGWKIYFNRNSHECDIISYNIIWRNSSFRPMHGVLNFAIVPICFDWMRCHVFRLFGLSPFNCLDRSVSIW